MRRISSRQSPLVRDFRVLADRPDAAGRVLLDGAHLVAEGFAAGARFEVVAVATSRLTTDREAAELAARLVQHHVEVVEVEDRVLAAMSPVKTPSGIVAIAHLPPTSPHAICARAEAFVVVLVDAQDPGNVGALVRAAEAGGATGALVCGASAHPFSWKALRGSMGSALRLPVVYGLSADAAIAAMRTSGVRTVAAVPRGGAEPDAVDWRGRVGLVLGGEGHGLTEALVSMCEARVTIPMSAPVESLNVAIAGAILVYAARRQRS